MPALAMIWPRVPPPLAVIAASVAHFRTVEARSARGADTGSGPARSNWKWGGSSWRGGAR